MTPPEKPLEEIESGYQEEAPEEPEEPIWECESCGNEVDVDWNVCPHCNREHYIIKRRKKR